MQLGTDEQLVGYISRPAASAQGGDGPSWEWLVSKLPEENMQLLNLAHSWLTSLLPFVLCKVGRVHFGLLAESDIARASASGSLPPARRLLAVPFVGKDVPSHAAEFAHPDALIGLTVLAYRHEGLRRSDFVGLLKLLLENMEQESGPFRNRPACRLYAHWVELAGSCVRGGRASWRPRFCRGLMTAFAWAGAS